MVSTKTIERAYCPECGEQFEPGTKHCPNDGTRLYSYQVRDASDDPLIGQTIDGRFRLDEVLGEGGMGRVYRGVQLSVDRSVAIKVLRPDLVEREDVIKRFLREARVISGFNHPNIVNLVDFGQDTENDVLYLAMELLDGLPLSNLLMRGRAHPNLICEVGLQVCRALAEAHRAEIVHRDLKPDNLMVVPMSDGSVQVKVLDFGIAHAVQGEQRLTSTGQVFGTAHYMAPEQASGNEVGPLTDVYSLGCILYEMACGRLPFDAPSVMGLLVAHVQNEPPPLADQLLDDDVPDALVDLIMAMLEKKPSGRPSSVLAVRDHIEAIRKVEGFGPVRIDPSRELERNLFQEWLRGSQSARLRETSEPLNLETKDGARTTKENEAFGTAETAAHESAPSLEPVPTFDEAPPAVEHHGGANKEGSNNTPTAESEPLLSDRSMELELARYDENRRLVRIVGGLLAVIVLVAVVAVVVATQASSESRDTASNDGAPAADAGGEAPAEPPEQAAVAQIAVDAGPAGADAAEKAAAAGARAEAPEKADENVTAAEKDEPEAADKQTARDDTKKAAGTKTEGTKSIGRDTASAPESDNGDNGDEGDNGDSPTTETSVDAFGMPF
jgi:serine/threonine-protein kinase